MKQLILFLCVQMLISNCFVSLTLTEVGPCYCGIFHSQNPSAPFFIQTVNYNLCTPITEVMCNELCVSLNTGTVDVDLTLFCNFIGDGVDIYMKVFSKMCLGNWTDTNLKPTDPVCCENGIDVSCEESK